MRTVVLLLGWLALVLCPAMGADKHSRTSTSGGSKSTSGASTTKPPVTTPKKTETKTETKTAKKPPPYPIIAAKNLIGWKAKEVSTHPLDKYPISNLSYNPFDQKVYCISNLRKADGDKKNWFQYTLLAFKLDGTLVLEKVLPYENSGMIKTSPGYLDKDTIYISHLMELACFNLANLQLVWKKDNSTADASAHFGAIPELQRIYVGCFRGACLNSKGEVLWQHDPGAERYFGVGSILPDGTCFAGVGSAHLKRENIRFDPDGKILWSVPAAQCSPKMSPTGKLIGFSEDGKKMVSLDPQNGNQLWEVDFPWGDFLVDPKGNIYIGKSEGEAYSFDPEGKLRWTCGSIVQKGPICLLGDGTVVFLAYPKVPDFDSFFGTHFFGLDSATGNIKWVMDGAKTLTNAPIGYFIAPSGEICAVAGATPAILKLPKPLATKCISTTYQRFQTW